MNRTLEPLRVLALDRPSQQASIIVDCPITTNDEPGDHVPCVNLLTVESVENDSFQSQSCADQLKALSEPLRLRIIDLLRHGEMTVGDIAEFLETEVVTVSHHL